MTLVVIDTNVLVIATSQSENISRQCFDNCFKFIIEVQTNGAVLLDKNGEILKEYLRNLKRERPYGLAKLFLIHLIQQQYNPSRVKLVELARDREGGFIDFPSNRRLTKFDRSDQKFVALARNTKIPVTTATDRGWIKFKAALKESGVGITFLCGEDRALWLSPNSRQL